MHAEGGSYIALSLVLLYNCVIIIGMPSAIASHAATLLIHCMAIAAPWPACMQNIHAHVNFL